MRILRQSPFSGIIHEMDLDITQAQMDAWRGGELVQNAFPNLSPSEREFLMTGITPDEWDRMFGEDPNN